MDTNNTVLDKTAFIDYLESCFDDNSSFVALSNIDFKLCENDPKIIAWYLPQFYRIKTNDEAYGAGFTEWSNSSRAFPMYTGHYQPHIPYDVGYYTLNSPDVIRRQAELARMYGIYGFCIHYYWFSGERTMERPLDILIENKDIDIKYCLNWATETWTAKWAGGDSRVIYEQKVCDDDPIKYVEDILLYLEDDRYIRVDNKPLLMIYNVRFDREDRIKYMIDGIRRGFREKGLGEVYLLVTNRYGEPQNADEIGIDGVVDYPINNHLFNNCKLVEYKGYLNSRFKGKIYDYYDYVTERKYCQNYKHNNIYYSAAVGFDDSSRYKYGAHIFHGASPEIYEGWLIDSIKKNREIHGAGSDFTFVGSWNEWAEGSHLEPDYKYGYAYLKATRNAILKVREQER